LNSPRWQIVEALANQTPPRYLLRDRDRIYGNEVRLRIASLQMEEVLTAPRSPWQNPYAERLIGSIRLDCLDHFVILNARHLKRTLSSYFAYYHGSRTHLGLDKQCPQARQVSSIGRIVKISHLSGLHHRYERFAAYAMPADAFSSNDRQQNSVCMNSRRVHRNDPACLMASICLIPQSATPNGQKKSIIEFTRNIKDE
jgi:hypothetical protein